MTIVHFQSRRVMDRRWIGRVPEGKEKLRHPRERMESSQAFPPNFTP